MFARKGWRSSTGVDRKVWQCSERYKVKGVMGCANRHVEEKTLIKAYLLACIKRNGGQPIELDGMEWLYSPGAPSTRRVPIIKSIQVPNGDNYSVG